MPILIAAAIILCLVLLWCLLPRPRRGQPGWDAFAAARFAHRGLHDLDAAAPENSLAAFRRAAERGLGAELDVHLLADGGLAVVHDSSLKRVCGLDREIEDLRREDLAACRLQGTGETIPLLSDVLDIFAGGPPLIIELKVARGNAAALTDAVMDQLRDWEGTYCLESFHPAALLRLKRRYPQVLRGQLSQDFLRRREGGLPLLARAAMTYLLTSALTRPDFIAYRWEDRGNVSLRLMRRLYGVHEAAWTVRDRDTLLRLEGEGAVCIFEGFIP